MKKILLTLAAAASMAAVSGAAFAAPKCTTEPTAKWMSEAKMKEHVAMLGYKDIKTFKTSGSCYEIYGLTKDGKKAEVYFNPVTGDVVQSNIGG